MPSSLNDYIHTKKLRYQLIPSRDIDDQGILESDWVKGTTDHTKPKVVVSDPACFSFPPWKISKVSIDFFQRYWWTKIVVEKILGHYYPDMRFSHNHEKHCHSPSPGYRRHINGINFWQKPKNYILQWLLGFFSTYFISNTSNNCHANFHSVKMLSKLPIAK